jgi:hypothetical protein
MASNNVIAENLGEEKPKKTFVAEDNNTNAKLKSFSLGSQMKFKGEKLIDNKSDYISFNTSITYQKGQKSYIVPFKKTVIVNSITFNPNEFLRNYSK